MSADRVFNLDVEVSYFEDLDDYRLVFSEPLQQAQVSRVLESPTIVPSVRMTSATKRKADSSKREQMSKKPKIKICVESRCEKQARSGSITCIEHGGGARCQHVDEIMRVPCTRAARKGNLCSSHGGGRRCQFDGCTKGALGGISTCKRHSAQPLQIQ